MTEASDDAYVWDEPSSEEEGYDDARARCTVCSRVTEEAEVRAVRRAALCRLLRDLERRVPGKP